MNAREIDRLRGPILRSVSRSFYLSLRILPRPLRDPLSLAYLLARATDTIADTPVPPAELRIEALQNLAWAIQGDAPIEAVADLRNSFAPLQSNEAERALIDALPAVLEWLELLDERDRSRGAGSPAENQSRADARPGALWTARHEHEHEHEH